MIDIQSISLVFPDIKLEFRSINQVQTFPSNEFWEFSHFFNELIDYLMFPTFKNTNNRVLETIQGIIDEVQCQLNVF